MKKIKNVLIFSFFSFFSFISRILADKEEVTATPCSDVLGGPDSELITFIVDLFNMIKWIALALAVGLGILDFFKAITGSSDDALKKAAQNFAKRLIGVVILFALPALLEWLLKKSGVPNGGTCLNNQ